MNPLKKELKKVKHTYDKNDIKSFYNNMLGSNWYKDRLINNGYGIPEPSSGKLETQIVKKLMPTSMMTSNVNALIKERKDSIKKTDIIKGSLFDDTAYYRDTENKESYIVVKDDQVEDLKAHPRSVVVHEYGHAEVNPVNPVNNNKAGISGYEKAIYKENAKDIKNIGSHGKYVLEPKEAKGDINSIRYNLYKSGKFNPKSGEYNTKDKKFDKSLIPNIKNDYNLKRMIDAYGEKGLTTLMNTIATTNTNNNKQYMAMGGTLRPSSRNRYIAPAIIAQAGIGLLGSALGIGAAAKAKKEQKNQMAKQNTDNQQMQWMEQRRGDMNIYNNTNLQGEDDIQYYAEGGNLNPLASTQQPMIGRAVNNSSLAGYSTKGGNLVQIGDGVEEARGNKHNQTKIDGVSGIQLHEEGNPEPMAEIEDKEILVDGNKVLSQQLKFKGNQSYADKMRQIVKKRNKLEKEQLETTSTRKKNTTERKLASLNMAEETLFQTQELHKKIDGTKTLDKLDVNKFALGGTLGEEPIVPNGKYKGWFKTAKGYYRHPNDKNLIVGENGNPMYNYELPEGSNVFGTRDTNKPVPGSPPVPNPSSPPALTAPVMGPQNNTLDPLTKSVLAGSTNTSPASAAASTATEATTSKFEDFMNSSTGQGVLAALPGIASGIGAYVMAGNTPKLPTPILTRAENLDTRVNVNPQVSTVRGSVKATVDNILQNTSSSSNARNNIASARLKGGVDTAMIYANKENQETQLRNADSQNRQMVAGANNATMNQHSMNQYQRLNDIRTMKSAGFAHITGAIANGLNVKRTADNFDAYTRANLADDKLGEKLDIYMNDRNFMANPSNRSTVMSMINAKNSDGTYKYPYERKNALKKGLITE